MGFQHPVAFLPFCFTKSPSSGRWTNEGQAVKPTPPTGSTNPGSTKSPSCSRQTNEGQTATPLTGSTNRGSTKSPSSSRQTNEGQTATPSTGSTNPGSTTSPLSSRQTNKGQTATPSTGGSLGSTVLGTETDSYDEDETENVLPLKGPGFEWYTERGINFKVNMARTEERTRNPVIMEDNQMKELVCGTAKGSLDQNVEVLIERLSTAGSSKQQNHLSAMISLANHITNNGLLVATQDLAKKVLSEIVAPIYIDGKGYIVENQWKEITKIVESLQQIRKADQTIVNQRVKEAIGSTFDTLLQYLDSKRDRDTVKAILTQITSAKLAYVQSKRSFQHLKGIVARNLQLFEDMKNEIQVTDPSMTEEGAVVDYE
ncbi:hypothetical protein OS493_014587 [Desmophyllum pertusum]|uniref:Uncharacterized protein n=1 Tax=Desmophyllum pertusum TaxID=174260 RepID=A0A9W9YPS4_9CNID|nr:hypothetical protein OS493_014587 [Desmophyllum pertusum]